MLAAISFWRTCVLTVQAAPTFQWSRHVFSETILGMFSHCWAVTASNRNQMEAGISSLAFFCVFFFSFCFSQVRPWRQGGALPGKGEAVAPGLQRSEGRSERSRRVFRRVPAAPGLPAHVVAALLQRRAAVAAEGLRGHAFQQRLRWRERGSKWWSHPPCV